MENISWYIANKDYIKYLKKFDNKVENIDYIKNLKPYIGIVFKINEFKYYVPISSPKTKHYSMKENMDFIKIMNKKGDILGILNLNNMVPIIDSQIEELKYSNLSNYRIFSSEEEKNKYISLLKIELKLINEKSKKILNNARKIYNLKNNNKNNKITKRTCDFKLLENKAKEYEKRSSNGKNR